MVFKPSQDSRAPKKKHQKISPPKELFQAEMTLLIPPRYGPLVLDQDNFWGHKAILHVVSFYEWARHMVCTHTQQTPETAGDTDRNTKVK